MKIPDLLIINSGGANIIYFSFMILLKRNISLFKDIDLLVFLNFNFQKLMGGSFKSW